MADMINGILTEDGTHEEAVHCVSLVVTAPLVVCFKCHVITEHFQKFCVTKCMSDSWNIKLDNGDMEFAEGEFRRKFRSMVNGAE